MATTMNPLAARLEASLANPNVQNYLRMIRTAEHGERVPDEQRYSRAFGNRVITDLSKYNEDFLVPFKQTDGKMNKTSAQGAYQFIKPTWGDASIALGLSDFSPKSQDLAALFLLNRNGSLQDVIRGDYKTALKKDADTWASLPGSKHPQPTQRYEKVAQWLGVPTSKLSETDAPGGFMMSDGRAVSGVSRADQLALDRIAGSQHSQATKERMVDVLGKMPRHDTPVDFLQADLPTELDNEFRQMIERA